MKTIYIYFKLGALISFTFLLISCKTMTEGFGGTYHYDKVHSLYSYSILKGGYWGEWEKQYSDYHGYSYRVQTHYNAQKLDILIYHKNNHPSDYIAKITIDKTTGKEHNKDWFSYQGIISCKQIPVLNAYSSSAHVSDAYKTLKCEIRCDEKMQKSIKENGLYGTVNLFYGNGMGDAFDFR